MPLRRLAFLFLFAGLSLLQAQDPSTKAEGASEESTLLWKIANFAIFAGGMGYFIVKYSPAFFNARSADIQKAIQDATGLKLTADLRYSEIDRKMANLAVEVGKLREQAQIEMEREHQRMISQANDEIAYIQRNTGDQVEALRSEGAIKLRAHATQEALAQAEARLRQRFATADQKDLLNEFMQLIERGKN